MVDYRGSLLAVYKEGRLAFDPCVPRLAEAFRIPRQRRLLYTSQFSILSLLQNPENVQDAPQNFKFQVVHSENAFLIAGQTLPDSHTHTPHILSHVTDVFDEQTFQIFGEEVDTTID